MDCIILLLLLSCCGGFGCGNNGTFYANNGCGRDNRSSLGNGNNVRRGYSDSDDDCGCSDNGVATVSNDCNDKGISTVSGGPSHWQDFPEISRRDNNSDCDCEN